MMYSFSRLVSVEPTAGAKLSLWTFLVTVVAITGSDCVASDFAERVVSVATATGIGVVVGAGDGATGVWDDSIK